MDIEADPSSQSCIHSKGIFEGSFRARPFEPACTVLSVEVHNLSWGTWSGVTPWLPSTVWCADPGEVVPAEDQWGGGGAPPAHAHARLPWHPQGGTHPPIRSTKLVWYAAIRTCDVPPGILRHPDPNRGAPAMSDS